MYLMCGWITAADKTLDYQAVTGANPVDLLALYSAPAYPLLTKVGAGAVRS